MSEKSGTACSEIQNGISAGEVVGAGETGCRVNGKKHRFHVWRNKCLTFTVSFKSRGHRVTEEYFPGCFPYYVSDCRASQLKTKAGRHRLCPAHLLRGLPDFEQALKSDRCICMKDLFRRATAPKKRLGTEDYRHPPKEVAALEGELNGLLKVDCPQFHPGPQALIKRLIKHGESICVFLTRSGVPPDNNASERAIRMVKVKTKVSGQFRNKEGRGADRYAGIRSVIDTAIKNGQTPCPALLCPAKC